MCNANSIKPKKSELSIFFFAYNLDIAANCELQFAPNRFSLPGYIVYHTDRDQFDGGVMLLVQNTLRHDQFLLPHVVN